VGTQADDAPIDALDDRIVVLFHEVFKEPIDSPTREALRELMFPSPYERSSRRPGAAHSSN
jgi:hypothetical protein